MGHQGLALGAGGTAGVIPPAPSGSLERVAPPCDVDDPRSPLARAAPFLDFRDAFARDAGLRIDHVLLSPPLAERLVSAGVDREVRGRDHASDHAPVWIELSSVAPPF